MDRAALELRVKGLKDGVAFLGSQINELRQQLEMRTVDLHQTLGALKECEHWLKAAGEQQNGEKS